MRIRIGIVATMLGLLGCSPGGSQSATAQANCMNREGLIDLDASWERALLESDVDTLSALMADEFVWTHNHVSSIDTKESVLRRAATIREDGSRYADSRSQVDVEARIVGSTGVVSGYTIVERGGSAVRFRFLRAYAEVKGSCLLVAGQTMAVPED